MVTWVVYLIVSYVTEMTMQCCNVRFSYQADRPINSIRNAVALLGPEHVAL